MIFNPITYSSDVFDIRFDTALPANVVENQIIVLNAEKPKSIIFSHTAPSTTQVNDIWIYMPLKAIGAYSLFSRNDVNVGVNISVVAQYNGMVWEYRESYIGINGSWVLFTDKIDPFEILPWELVGAIAGANIDCSSLFAVGDEKSFTLTTGEEVVVIIGDFNHNILSSDESKAAQFALTFKKCLDTEYILEDADGFTNGWVGTDMYQTHLPAIFATFPVSIRNIAKAVKVESLESYSEQNIITTNDILRLHSITELGTTYSYSSTEGVAYSYYSSATSRIKYLGETATEYWTRSMYTGSSTRCCTINSAGGATYEPTTSTAGVMCAFDI